MTNVLTSVRSSWIGSTRQLLLKRHMRIILRHLTVKKVGNIVLNMTKFLMRKSNSSSTPIYLKIEPSHFCHLKCPGCASGKIKDSQLKFEDFKKIVDPLSDRLVGISLSHQGEPLWCDDLPKMIDYANSKNIGTTFPTNLSIPMSDERIEDLVKAGPDMIMVSLDGVTRESYKGYRVGGNFDLILENVQKLAETKKRLNSNNPDIHWKFIIFDHNRNELEYEKENYGKLGFDSYSFITDKYNKKIAPKKNDY